MQKNVYFPLLSFREIFRPLRHTQTILDQHRRAVTLQKNAPLTIVENRPFGQVALVATTPKLKKLILLVREHDVVRTINVIIRKRADQNHKGSDAIKIRLNPDSGRKFQKRPLSDPKTTRLRPGV